MAAIGVDGFPDGVDGLDDDFLHDGDDVSVDVDATVGLLLVQQLLESPVAQLVAVFELPVGIQLFLDSVVGQVDSRIVHVLEVNAVLAARGPDVAFAEVVEVVVLVEEHPDPDVELTLANQQGPFDVFLNNEGVVLDLVQTRSFGQCLGWTKLLMSLLR